LIHIFKHLLLVKPAGLLRDGQTTIVDKDDMASELLAAKMTAITAYDRGAPFAKLAKELGDPTIVTETREIVDAATSGA